MSCLLEIACFDLGSVLVAQAAGADRIELCEAMDLGGITPSAALVEKALAGISIPLFAMVRPRGGDFFYSVDEFEKMKKDLEHMKSMNVSGFVFGVLDKNKKVDVKRNMELVTLAAPLPCTFHRAFDEIPDSFSAIDEIAECGFRSILTSGKEQTAIDGATHLAAMVRYAGDRIVIMPGGRIRSANIAELKKQSGAVCFHSAAITDNSKVADAGEIMKLKRQLQ